MSFDVQSVRAQFPSLKSSQVFFDNAGGAQTLGTVIDEIATYLREHNVQLGATYGVSQASTSSYNKGIEAAAKYINADVDETVIGPSTTQLFRNLSVSLLPHLLQLPLPEIVISSIDHEANIASWLYLARLVPNLTVKFWTPSPSSNPQQTLKSLAPLLSENTVLVTLTHTSNILGTINPVKEIARLVHTIPGAMVCIDSVAYAPHRPIDVKELDVDFLAFSWYKVFGPHTSQLYCSRKSQDQAMTSLGHFFKPGWSLEDKLGLAAASYELVSALPAVTKYLDQQSWDHIIAHEAELSERLLSHLRSKPEVYTIFGEPVADNRVAVISFRVRGYDPRDIVEKVEKQSPFGFRFGHFYSKRLVNDVLGLDDNGVIRVSMLHYNSIEEVEGFVKALDAIIS